MAIPNPYQSYKQNSVNTASPGELTLMLYNGCLKFIHQAKKAMSEKNIQDKNNSILRAQDIIRELMVTLNPEIEVGKQMMSMYDYMLRRLVEANIKNDLEILDEVEGLVTEFRDTWKQVIQINRQKQFSPDGRV
ncbi:flagellar export chaperone FliS [Mesobacillus selenatarsenatis]|uniref:Flagellar secretion chaperone FliS n=1 Tax=Mesobacillus selenatarsenatis TaxID=388741 RepID=A0A846TCK1_9BACI|nr:flagellar export chaperone FliS [Mesobacillus selenatarsenatis]NKE06788.1 flagellar export chaperone FliS [Mesobacillus selenatarsenatis]